MKRGFVAAFGAMLVIALTVGGCGGGGGDSSSASTTASLTKAQFIKQGDEICKDIATEYSSRMRSLGKKKQGNSSKDPEKAEQELIAEAVVPPLESGAEKLDAMVPPSGSEDEAKAIVAALEGAAAELEANPGQEPTGPNSPFAEFDKLTKAYGFAYCSGF